MPYSAEYIWGQFEKSVLEGNTPEEKIETLRHDRVCGYRVKTYRYGGMVECEVYPLFKKKSEALRAPKAKISTEAQANLNHINAENKIIRYINNNFSLDDHWVTLGYGDGELPETTRAARRHLINYLNRIKRRRAKLGLPELKYIYVTEFADVDGDPIRVHHHVILSGGMDRDELEREWYFGDRPQARNLYPDDMGLTGLAKYLAKAKNSQKLWAHSKNLAYPKPTVADKKLTRRQVEKMSLDVGAAAEFFEKAYKGFVFSDVGRDLKISYSDFIAGAYLHVRMRRRETVMTRRCADRKSKAVIN